MKEKKPSQKELKKTIQKELLNFGCLMCDKFIGSSMSGLYHHLKKVHDAKMKKGETWDHVDATPKDDLPKKKRKHKTHKKVIDDAGDEVLVPIPTRWEDTDEAHELYLYDREEYLYKLKQHYPDHDFSLTDYEQEEVHGIFAGGRTDA